jgi:hypothetical protein
VLSRGLDQIVRELTGSVKRHQRGKTLARWES